jgi:hypothetical protein
VKQKKISCSSRAARDPPLSFKGNAIQGNDGPQPDKMIQRQMKLRKKIE